MNEKRAKFLRRVARGRTIGQPDQAHVRKIAKTTWDDEGNAAAKETITLHPDCTRGVYQRMKAAWSMYRARV